MAAALPTLVISPVGELDDALTSAVCRQVQKAFGMATAITHLLSDLAFAFDAPRGQYHSTKILERLAEAAPSLSLKVLAITDVDLFIPILTYVFGEAQLGGKASIISTHRLAEGPGPSLSPDVFRCRAGKEAVHELGHTFNLRHCREKTCVMHYCRSIRDVDRKSEQLCRYCSTLLGDELKRLGLIRLTPD
jgi:archaemetzincin